MNAPLSRYLTRFSSGPTAVEEMLPEPITVVPMMTLEVAAYETRLEAQRRVARLEAEAEAAEVVAALRAAHDVALTEALAAARAEWCDAEGARVAADLGSALASLRETVSERVAAILRPLLARAVVGRTAAALGEALDQLLAEPDHPCLTVCGPTDLLAAIAATRPARDGLAYVVADNPEVRLTADGLRIETRLALALDRLADKEP